MKISEEQLHLLNSLKVERLHDSIKRNKNIVDSFKNDQNKTLENILKSENTRKIDEDGHTAYYIVTTSNDDLLMYFSLKCGELHKKLEIKNFELLDEAIKKMNLLKYQNLASKEQIADAILFLQQNNSNILPLLNSRFINKKNLYKEELANEKNPEVNQVLKTFSAVEMVEFCANENAKTLWEKLGLKRKMGECIFWHCIFPKIIQIQDIAGCQYMYLFAADSSKELTLVAYYQSLLGFEMSGTLGTNKPHYDFTCIFMCAEINKLKDKQKDFYEDFNHNELDENIV